MQKRKLIRFLLLPIGIIGVLVIMLVVPLNYTPDTSVPFPYIPPPERYYIEATPQQLHDEFFSPYRDPFSAEVKYVGKSFIFKNIFIDKEILSRRHEAYVWIDLIQFVPHNPSDLQELKEGDMVDIIGVCAGMSKEYAAVVVANCRFLPAGLAPLPLPGGPAPVIGGY